MTTGAGDVLDQRREFCHGRLAEVRERIARFAPEEANPHLCIYVTGSFGRKEASAHSDLDIFFVDAKPKEPSLSRIKKTLIDADLIRMCKDMKFPQPSGDGRYLTIHPLQDLTGQLGSQEEDASNVFTARLLLLLESNWLFNEPAYGKVIEACVTAYFQDYHKHPGDFRPTFLVNDILRFWKTLCLNYEHKRNRPNGTENEKKRLEGHLKNFKLKFSRMLTCHSMVAQLCRKRATITPADVIEIVKTQPLCRLLSLAKEFGGADMEARFSQDYAWFLGATDRPEDEQLKWIADKAERQRAFARANEFGDRVFQLVSKVAEEAGTLRYLVV